MEVKGKDCPPHAIAVPPTARFFFTGLAAGTSYSYRVRATDAAGNLSPYSNTATFSTAPAIYGPVTALGFHEGDGTTTADQTGNGIHGTLQGAAWTSSGKFGRAVSFNGSNSYIDLGNAAPLQMAGSMTLSAWVLPTVHPPDDGQIVAKSDGNAGWQLKTSPDTGVRTFGIAISSGTSRVQRYSRTVYSLGTWYHVAGVYDAAARTLDIYVNGVLDNGVLTGSIPAAQLNAGVNAQIGRRSGGFYFGGIIDEVRVDAQAQTPAQVQADMGTAIGGVPETGTMSPTGGQGKTQTFTISATHGGGAAMLTEVMILFNGVLNEPGSCWVSVKPQTGTANVINDAGTGLATGTVSTGTGSAANSQCTLSGGGFSVTKSGNKVTATLPITFSNGFTGTKNVYQSVTDSRGESAGWTPIGTWSIAATGGVPQTGTVTPGSGSGVSQVFTATAHHSGGAQRLTSLQILIGSTLNGPGSCWLSVNLQTSWANLINDAGTGFGFGTIATGYGSASNSQCTISGSGFSVTKSGNTVSVTLPVTFGSGYGGAKTVYEYLTDDIGQISNWAPVGTWSVPAGGVPQPGALSPTGSTGGSQTFTVTSSHGGGANQLSNMMVLFGSFLYGPGSCWVSVDLQSKTANLVNDTATGFVDGTISPGVSSAGNSQCAFFGEGFSVTKSGNTVTVTLPLRFNSSFAGVKTVYQYLTDASGQIADWTPIGMWNALGYFGY